MPGMEEARMQEIVSMTAGEVPLQNGRGFPIGKALIGIGAVVALLALGSQVAAYVPRSAPEIESSGRSRRHSSQGVKAGRPPQGIRRAFEGISRPRSPMLFTRADP